MSAWSNLDGMIGRKVSWQSPEDRLGVPPREGVVVGYREHIAKGLLLIVVTDGKIEEVRLTDPLLAVGSR